MTPVLRLVAFVLLLALPAAAQTPPPTPSTEARAELERLFRQGDTDGDGRLTLAEAQRGNWTLDETFSAVDADQDGGVTLVELVDFVRLRVQDWLSGTEARDADGDGAVSRGEASGSFLEIFERADLDRNGRITRQEYEVYSQRQLYRSTELPSVYPNIFERKF